MNYNESDFDGLQDLFPLGNPPELVYNQNLTNQMFETLNDLLDFIYLYYIFQ